MQIIVKRYHSALTDSSLPLPLSSSFRHTGGGSAPAAAAGAPAAAAAPAAKAAPVEEEVDALDGESRRMSHLEIWIQPY